MPTVEQIESQLKANAEAVEIYGIDYGTDMDGNGPDPVLFKIGDLIVDLKRWTDQIKDGHANKTANEIDEVIIAISRALHRKW